MYGETDRSAEKPVNAASFAVSLVLHGGLVCAILAGSWIIRLFPRETVIPIDMTVVVDENLDRDPDDLTPSEKPPEPEPPKEKPKPPEPEPPKEKVPDAVVQEKPKKKEFKKGKLVKEEEKTKTDEKKKPEEKKKDEKKFNKSTKIVKGAKPPKKNAGNGPRTEKKLSAAEIAKALADGAKPGTVNQLAEDDVQRCFSLVNAQIKAHTPETYQWSPALKSAVLEIRMDPAGRIVNFALVNSSGDPAFDACVLSGVKRTGQFVGLTPAFISRYSRFTIEVKPTRK